VVRSRTDGSRLAEQAAGREKDVAHEGGPILEPQARRRAQAFRVAFLVLPDFSMMALAAALEPLRSLNRQLGEARYEWVLIGRRAGTVTSSSGLTVEAAHGIDKAPAADLTVVVASLDLASCRDRALFAYLRRLRAERQLIGAVSNGTLILARAGLLAGRRATIHWEMEQHLAEAFPDVRICRTLYCRDGDFLTAGGGTAAMDMMLDLIAARDGHDAAAGVADQFLHGRPRPPEEPQREDVCWRYQLTDHRLEAAIRMMQDALANPVRIARVAEACGISERQLERLFQTAFGRSPSAFYRELRLKASRARLLETTDTLEEIAEATGFSSPAHFSRAVKAWCGSTPHRLRLAGGGGREAVAGPAGVGPVQPHDGWR
jgi:transcriptional regulator GlxA family with amidase domain